MKPSLIPPQYDFLVIPASAPGYQCSQHMQRWGAYIVLFPGIAGSDLMVIVRCFNSYDVSRQW